MSENSSIPQESAVVRNNHNKRKRNFWLFFLALLFVLIGLAWLFYWLFVGRFYVYTDDAYVFGNQVPVTPQVSSGVVAIYSDNTDLVTKGQLIIQLDRTVFEIDFQEKKASLAERVRKVAQLFEQVKENEAQVALRKAELDQRILDLNHREGLKDTGAISKEELEQANTNKEVAQSRLNFAERQLISSQLQVQNVTVETHPLVKEAIAALKASYLNLVRCQVWAPVTGYVAKRIAQVGDQVMAGQTMLTIVPLDEVWMEANYKETQLKHVRIGQPVTFTADIYGRDVKYRGYVLGFSAGTGSAFALLPPQNASGNWIKIVQRVPIRIIVHPEDIKKFPLLIGLSLHVYVDVHDTSAPVLSPVPTEKLLYSTPIYDKQVQELQELDPIIENIIRNNNLSEQKQDGK